MKDIVIADKNVGLDHDTFIIAEMSANHAQSLDAALAIVDAVAQSGASALKVQTYMPDTMTLDVHDGDFFINDQQSPWKGASFHQLYKRAYLPWEWHKKIFQRCREVGLIGFSTPFDETAVDFLEELEVPCYKIASFENVHLSLIKKVAQTGKPLIISTGLATVSELHDAVNAARSAGCKDLILLKSDVGGHARADEVNLKTIPHLRDLFKCQVGLSDHTLGIGVGVASVVFGATVIEKHVTLSRAFSTADAGFSMEPHELKMLVEECRQARMALGDVFYGPTQGELSALAYRRSLYISQNLGAGEILTREHVKVVRPGNGLSPKHLDSVVGATLVCDVKKGTPVTWDLIKEKGY